MDRLRESGPALSAPAAIHVSDTDALRYAGIFGHPFAVTCDEDADGNRRLLGQCNDAETALKWAAEATRRDGAQANGRAWRHTQRGYVEVKAKA